MRDNIQETLKEYYEEITKKYGSDNILGVFLYGSQNYNFAIEKSDIDAKAIYLPPFFEVAGGRPPMSKELHMDNGAHVELKDIREMCKMWKKQNINFVEILFTKYYIINPKYSSIFKEYFINSRNAIAYYNPKQTVVSIGSQALNTIRQKNLTGKQVANFYRLAFFLDSYTDGKPYEECLLIPEDFRDTLINLKVQKDYSSILRFEDLKEAVKNIVNSYKDAEFNGNPEVDEIMLLGAAALLRERFKYDNNF